MRPNSFWALAAATLLGLGAAGFGADGKSGGGKDDKGKPGEGKKSFDLSFIPEDCSWVMILHPKRIFESPLARVLSAEDTEVLLRDMNKSRGIDVRKIEQDIFLESPLEPDRRKPGQDTGMGRIERFSEPVINKESLAKLFGNWVLVEEPIHYQGKQYYKGYDKRFAKPPKELEEDELWGHLAVHIADARTVAHALPPQLLRKMLAANQAKGGALDKLRQLDTENDLCLVAATRDSLKYMTRGLPDKTPPGTKWLVRLPDLGRAVTFTANLRGVPVAKLLVEAKDADSAAKLRELATEDIEAARKAYGAASQQKGQIGMELLSAIFNDLSVAQEGTQVTVTLDKPEALAKLPAFLATIAEGKRQQQNRLERRVRNPGQVGMVVVFEVEPDGTPLGAKKPEADMRKLIAALDRRLNPSGRPAGRIRQLDGGRIEVSIFQADRDVMQRIANLLPRPGTLEFRVLANAHDHQQLIERARAKPDSKRLVADDGSLAAWWVPVLETAKKEFDRSKEREFDASEKLATRTVTAGGRQVLELLVVKDSFDVNGGFLRHVAAEKDLLDHPCVAFTLSEEGARRFGGLTESNLPEPGGARTRKLGIIVDGVLHSAPVIMGKISERGQVTGRFTPEQVQDLADLLNAGSLPAAIRQVEQRLVEVEEQPAP